MTCSALSPVFSHDWTQAGRWKFQDHPNSFCAPCADRTAPKTILTAATTQSPFVLIRFSNISTPLLHWCYLQLLLQARITPLAPGVKWSADNPRTSAGRHSVGDQSTRTG